MGSWVQSPALLKIQILSCSLICSELEMVEAVLVSICVLQVSPASTSRFLSFVFASLALWASEVG